jgi:two-component system phosphate regulon sensor histidine kinase PhoR
MKIRTKLSILLIVLTSMVISAAGYFSIVTLGNYYHDRMIDELKTQAFLFESIVRRDGGNDSISYAFIQQLAHTANVRLTLITDDGTVVFESELLQSQLGILENHKNRPEVIEALSNKFGVSTRHSTTLNIEMLYLAKHLTDPPTFGRPLQTLSILRVGLPLTVVSQRLSDVRSKILTISSILLVIVVGISLFVARRITNPVRMMNATAEKIRNGNLGLRIRKTSNDELGQLGDTLNNMIDRLNNDIVQFKKLERVRSEFLGNVSHELRTPIFTIQGMLETLLNGALDDKEVSKDFIERALRNTRRLGTLLGDLIEISRIESGDMKMSYRYFDIDDFLGTIVGEYLQESKKKNIVLTYSRPSRRIEVFGDRDRLRQVMVNLIDNALKYTPANGTVEIAVDPGENEAAIIVKDTGVGIPGEHLPRIFERFYRVDKERSREAGGTGLGLAIVKHIVEAHGSTIKVESTVGKGSIFRFSLKT